MTKRIEVTRGLEIDTISDGNKIYPCSPELTSPHLLKNGYRRVSRKKHGDDITEVWRKKEE